MSKLNEKLSTVIGEKAIIEQRKGRESDVLRHCLSKWATGSKSIGNGGRKEANEVGFR